MESIDCFICGNRAIETDRQHGHVGSSYACENCGKYSLSYELFTNGDPEPITVIHMYKHLLSGYLRECTERNLELGMIRTDNLSAFIKNRFIPKKMEDKTIKMLLFMNIRKKRNGDVIEASWLCKYPATCYAKDIKELNDIRQYLIDNQFIEPFIKDNTIYGYSLTVKGQIKAEKEEEKFLNHPIK